MPESIIDRLQSRLTNAQSNKAALKRESEILRELEEITAEQKQLHTRMAEISAQQQREVPIMGDQNARQRLAPPFVNGEQFPPPDMDLREAVGALLSYVFAKERREVLNTRHRALELEANSYIPRRERLRNELVKVQAELEAV